MAKSVTARLLLLHLQQDKKLLGLTYTPYYIWNRQPSRMCYIAQGIMLNIITYKGKESEKEYTHTHTHIYIYVYTHITESVCFIPETYMIL